MTSSQEVDGHVARLAELFVRLGGDLAGLTPPDVLQRIADDAFRLVPSADHASITRGRSGQFETPCATSELPRRVDQIQYELGSGPCVDAALTSSVSRIDDLAADPTWPEFGRRAAAEYGVRSIVAVRLFVPDNNVVAGLNVYSTEVAAFDSSDEATLVLLAAHGGLAVAAAMRQAKIDNLGRALQSNRRIGMAVGVLMNAHRVTEEQAFGLLRVASQHRQRKIQVLAEEVLQTGTLDLPALPDQRRR